MATRGLHRDFVKVTIRRFDAFVGAHGAGTVASDRRVTGLFYWRGVHVFVIIADLLPAFAILQSFQNATDSNHELSPVMRTKASRHEGRGTEGFRET